MYGWSDRPAKAAVKHRIGGDTPKTVYSIGKYEVSVPGEEVEITYNVPYYRNTDPRQAMPNMEVTDGEIRIPVTDLVEQVLARLDPADLARELWQNDGVKEEFMECLAERWGQNGLDDNDRRRFLVKIKEAVHSASVDRLANAASKLEWQISQIANHYHEVDRINETLRELNVVVLHQSLVDGEWVEDARPLQFNSRDRPIKDETGRIIRGELEVGGKCWEEARDYWRDEMNRAFPAPSDED